VFKTIRGDVDFSFACLATTDPVSGLINAAYKSMPLPMGDEDFAAAEYGGPDVNLFDEISRRPEPVGVLSVDTDGDVARCRRLREYMTPQFGFTDELRLACRGQQTVWGLVALYRGAGEPPFTAAEGRLLAGVHEMIADGIRLTLFTERFSRPGSPASAVLIIDADDRVTDASSATEEVVETLGGWDHGSLPASALMVVASARRRASPAEAQVPTRDGGWSRVRALPLGQDAGRPQVVLTIEPADPATIGQLTITARGLTTREQEIVALVLQGASTKDIASSLFLSPHTVQDHLKAVFAKLGVNSRRELIGRFVLT
jgi:DNA-binding CsgD family transcriptional regulator